MRAPSTVVREPTRSGFVEDVARGAGSTSPDIPGVWSRSAVHRRHSLGLSIAQLASGEAQTFRVTMVGARIVEHYGLTRRGMSEVVQVVSAVDRIPPARHSVVEES